MSVDIYANLRMAGWREALRLLAVQFAGLVIVALVAMLGWGARAGLGAVMGATIGLLANVYLAVALLGKPLLMTNVLLTWFVKVTLTLSLLWIALRANFVPPLSLLAGLFGAIAAHWLVVTFWFSGRR
jgi:F0F1-type ATP synthase assembly protein I